MSGFGNRGRDTGAQGSEQEREQEKVVLFPGPFTWYNNKYQ